MVCRSQLQASQNHSLRAWGHWLLLFLYTPLFTPWLSLLRSAFPDKRHKRPSALRYFLLWVLLLFLLWTSTFGIIISWIINNYLLSKYWMNIFVDTQTEIYVNVIITYNVCGIALRTLYRAGTAVVVLGELFSAKRNISVPDSCRVVKMLSVKFWTQHNTNWK